jgi:hypothetical protein
VSKNENGRNQTGANRAPNRIDFRNWPGGYLVSTQRSLRRKMDGRSASIREGGDSEEQQKEATGKQHKKTCFC